MRNNVYFKTFFCLLIPFFLMVTFTKVHAVEDNLLIPFEPNTDSYVQVGALRYGIGRSVPDYNGSRVNTGIPNVQYVDSKNNTIKIIDHIRNTGVNSGSFNKGGYTTSGFNISENIDQYNNPLADSMPSGAINGAGTDSAGQVSFKDGGYVDPKDPEQLLAKGKKIKSNDFDILLKLKASKDRSYVLHTFEVTNTSAVPKTIYPTKQVDTELANNDDVDMFSRGPGKGLYIESGDYRLDYLTEFDDGPIMYSGDEYYYTFYEIFGNDPKNPKANSYSLPKDEKLVSELDPTLDKFDTGIYLSWGAVTLKPGQTESFSYAVGISKVSTMDVVKEVKNTTTKDDLNRVKDVLEYKVTLKNKEPANTGVLKKNRIIDELPSEVDKPSNITLVDTDGNSRSLNVADVYDESTHKMTVPVSDMLGQETAKLTFNVTLNSKSAGKTVTNVAEAKWEGTNQIDYDQKASVSLDVLKSGKVISHYQDKDKNKLAEPKEIEGELDDPYEVKPINIFGYTHTSTNGPAKGKFTADDQIVTFIYDQKKMFDLNKSVVNSKGTNVNNGDVALEDTLTYTTDLVPNKPDDLTTEQKNTIYKDISITEIINANLEDPTDITLINGSGQKIGTAVFNPTDRTITATVTGADKVKITDSIKLTYKAKVKKETPMKTVISQQAKSTVKYVQDDLVRTLDSNIVKSTVNLGELLLVTAPDKVEFGDVKVSDYKNIVGSTIDKELVVKDTAKNKDWKVTVKLIEEMTNKGNGLEHSIDNSLYAKYKGVLKPMTLNNEVIVYQTDITSSPLTEDNITVSKEWGKEEAKDGIKLKTSKLPKTGNYQGTVEWSLSNTQ